MNTPDPWITQPSAMPTTARLFCLPFAGGSAAFYRPWQQDLGERIELCAAQLPARGARLFEPPLSDLASLVEQLLQGMRGRLDQPFALFGHSLGALLAFELARALRREGLPLPRALLVSGAEGPQTRASRRQLHDLPEDELIEALREYNGTPPELLAEREMMQLLLPGLRADFCLAECYRYQAEPPLPVPLQILRGDRDPYVEAERAAGWALETSLPVRQHVFGGDHFFLQAHQANIVTLLREVLPPAHQAEVRDGSEALQA